MNDKKGLQLRTFGVKSLFSNTVEYGKYKTDGGLSCPECAKYVAKNRWWVITSVMLTI
jgi:hypothetical protein